MSNNITSSPPYGSTAYSSNTSYGGIVSSDGSSSNQYVPDSKSWQWHKGDKCMAKYWEDNMVSFVILIVHVLFFIVVTYMKFWKSWWSRALLEGLSLVHLLELKGLVHVCNGVPLISYH
jgi:hypothetical protein